MAKKLYNIVAYPDKDGYPRREATVSATDRDDALAQGWKIFPEYHEINAFEVS